jgi:hypothetical protein
MDTEAGEHHVSVSVLGQRVVLDPSVPGVEATHIAPMISVNDQVVHICWSKSQTRAALMHLYDALAAAGITAVHPPKADALLGWQEMHPSTALVPVENKESEWGIATTGDVILLGDTFDALLESESEVYINHVWVICNMLQFPVSSFEGIHLHIATELFQRCTGDKPSNAMPHVFVRSYRFKGVVAPLLVWYRVHEHQVTCMLQEFLHVRYAHIPNAAVWYWQLLPYHVNLNHVGKVFDAEEILPSLRRLLCYAAVPKAPIGELDPDRLQCRGQKQADRIATDYGGDRHALWLGTEVFFYVEGVGDGNPLTNVRIPISYQELPPWVMALLCEVSHGTDAFAIGMNVNTYLHTLSATATRSTQLLRSINWAAVPLVWRPMFMQGCDTCVTAIQAGEAQARLIKAIAPSWEEPETVLETIERLARITGI